MADIPWAPQLLLPFLASAPPSFSFVLVPSSIAVTLSSATFWLTQFWFELDPTLPRAAVWCMAETINLEAATGVPQSLVPECLAEHSNDCNTGPTSGPN
ncbi:unnamed protein product, partial [Prorocentrum cordatum]